MSTAKEKEGTLKVARKIAHSYIQGSFHKTIIWFFNRKFAGQIEYHNRIKEMKDRVLQSRLFYMARLSIRIEGKIWSFPDK